MPKHQRDPVREQFWRQTIADWRASGRKNWLFFGSDRGGRTLAILASFTATCQQFGVEPWNWLRNTLTALPTTPADQLATLLPASTKS